MFGIMQTIWFNELRSPRVHRKHSPKSMSRLARARLGLMRRLAENDRLPRDNVIRRVSKWHD